MRIQKNIESKRNLKKKFDSKIVLKNQAQIQWDSCLIQIILMHVLDRSAILKYCSPEGGSVADHWPIQYCMINSVGPQTISRNKLIIMNESFD